MTSWGTCELITHMSGTFIAFFTYLLTKSTSQTQLTCYLQQCNSFSIYCSQKLVLWASSPLYWQHHSERLPWNLIFTHTNICN